MNGICRYISLLLLLLPLSSLAQKITYSALIKESSTIEILGKVNGNILILKDQRNKYAIYIYQEEMVLKEKVALDFINASEAYNVDFIIYHDCFYIIYQYQKKGVVYCMAVKMDSSVKKMNEPMILDTTVVGPLGDIRVYNVIVSEDRQKIMIYKILQKAVGINIVTFLYDNKLELIHPTSYLLDYDENNYSYSDFLIDNEGNLVFARSIKFKGGEDLERVDLITKGSVADTFSIKNIPLNNCYIDDMKIKVDNVNKHYLLNSFYYVQRQGNIEGIYSIIWDVKGDSTYASRTSPISDSIRKVARKSGVTKEAFNEYFINSIILKKDGGYILIAEDCSNNQVGSNMWRRHYSQSFFYLYYYNIFVCSISNKGITEWSNIIPKKQSAYNFSSFNTFNSAEGIHFLYNTSEKRNFLIMDNVVSADGKITRNPSLKSYDTGYDFMIRLSKKTGAKELIVPCLYRGKVSFAKVVF
jgi:hypothetical protein